MKKRTIGIGIKRVNVIYRDAGILVEREFEFAKSTTHSECVQTIQEELYGLSIEAIKSKYLGIRKYEVEEDALLKLLEEAKIKYE